MNRIPGSCGSSLALVLTAIALGDVRNENAQLVATPTVAGDTVAFSVASDGSTIVLGAYRKNFPGYGDDSGALFLFEPDGGGWSQSNYIVASDGHGFDYFGWSVDIDGDVIAVGAPWSDWPAGRCGSTYLFRRAGQTWVEEKRLHPNDLPEDAVFGHDVDLDGERLIVGAPWLDEDIDGKIANAHGAAYIFRDASGTWIQEARLAPGDATVSHLGEAVAIEGDLAVIGAPKDNGDGISAGAVYVYRRGGTGTWTLLGRMTPDEPEPYGYFGGSIAIEGTTVLVGAEYSDRAGPNSGAVYCFEIKGDAWSQVQVLVPGEDAPWAHFGVDVAIRGDRVIIGAHGDSQSTGEAQLFRRNTKGVFEREATLRASDGLGGERAGQGVALDAGLAIVGAPFWSLEHGSAYVYDLSDPIAGNSYSDTADDAQRVSWFGTYKGHDYFVTTAGVEYYDGRQAADLLAGLVNQEANMVTINTEAEHDFIQATSLDRMWIGLNDLAVEGDHVWDSGQDVTFTYWSNVGKDNEEPNEGIGSEDAVGMNGYSKEHAWFDWPALLRFAPALLEVEGQACSGDANFDFTVDLMDMLEVFDDWGLPGGHADVNHDGLVDVTDVRWILWNWGPCP